MNFRKLPLCSAIGLLTLAMAAPVLAQDESDKDKAESDKSAKSAESDKQAAPSRDKGMEEIIVTGTLINRPTITDIAPVTVIDSEAMKERGLVSLGDVMQSMTENSGYSEGKASNLLGRFTTGAEEVNMRGLGVGRTLVLVNGRRIADYPLPFGGEQNGVDMGSIPFAAISRVDYLSSGASATYGSDAVGGVINLITKRDMEQTTVDITTGMYEDGYGENVDASVVTGNSFERGSFTVGLQARYNDDPMASDVEFLDDQPYNARMVSLAENTIDGYKQIPMNEASCGPLGFEAGNSVCTLDASDTISMYPRNEQLGGFFDGRYDLTDQIELFGTLMANGSNTKSLSNVLFWDGVVVDEDGSAATFVSRGFSPAELGAGRFENDQTMWTTTVGAKGGFAVADDTWYWDASWSHAQYDVQSTSINLKEEGIRAWMLDGASSVVDSEDQRYTYFVNSDFYHNQLTGNVLRPVAASDVDKLIGENRMDAESTSDSVSLILNGTTDKIPFLYEPAKFALLTEFATQSTHVDPDARTLNTTGQGWYNIGALASDGDRDRAAAAAELSLPVLADLDVTLAARYDHYDDASDITGRATTQVKFLYRATDWLKVRGNYSQTFRAPDMFNIYGQSDAFETVTDFMGGCYDDQDASDCPFVSVSTSRQSDPGLTEEHGDDLGIGLIWTPATNVALTADLYNITLKDLVVTESSQDLLLKEWQCQNGELDGSSQLCADVQSRVIRNGFGSIEKIIIRPINQDELEQTGLDLHAEWSIDFEKIGQFALAMSHSKVLDFTLKRFSGDESINVRYGEPGASTPENTTSVSASWFNPLTTGRAVSASLFAIRMGKVYDYAHTQFMDPMYSVNFVAGYQLNARTSLRFTANNLLDTQPDDNHSGFWPGYWEQLQTDNALGRSYYLSLGYSFD